MRNLTRFIFYKQNMLKVQAALSDVIFIVYTLIGNSSACGNFDSYCNDGMN